MVTRGWKALLNARGSSSVSRDVACPQLPRSPALCAELSAVTSWLLHPPSRAAGAAGARGARSRVSIRRCFKRAFPWICI